VIIKDYFKNAFRKKKKTRPLVSSGTDGGSGESGDDSDEEGNDGRSKPTGIQEQSLAQPPPSPITLTNPEPSLHSPTSALFQTNSCMQISTSRMGTFSQQAMPSHARMPLSKLPILLPLQMKWEAVVVALASC